MKAVQSAATKTTTLQPVLADAAYPLELLRSIAGLDEWALRTAQRNGLKTITVGRRKFILGSDFIRYLQTLADRPPSQN